MNGRGRPASPEKSEAVRLKARTFQSSPCRNCGTCTKYLSNGSCVLCSKARAQRNRENGSKRDSKVVTFAGQPCRVCGGVERYESNFQCTACKRAQTAARRAKAKLTIEGTEK